MKKSGIEYFCYDPAQYSVKDIAELVIHSNLWAEYHRKILKDFERAVHSQMTGTAISEWVEQFHEAADKPEENPFFSSFVAVTNNQLVGFISTGHDVWDDTQRTGEIKSLAVHRGYWKQGIGTRLLTAAEMFLQSVNCRRATLWVEPDNTPAMMTYRKAGWKQTDGEYHVMPSNDRMVNFCELEKNL